MTKTIFDSRNISMMMDLYELTMANGYFTQEQQARRVAFDVFYRRNPDEGGFAIFAGLEQILQYLARISWPTCPNSASPGTCTPSRRAR